VGWHGIVAPAGTDPAILARVNAALSGVLRKPDVAERVAALGLEPVDAPPEALGRVIHADAERWAEVVRRARIQPD
jgi:tripartite-type tricarboxylate transporter receptor subunit TctC